MLNPSPEPTDLGPASSAGAAPVASRLRAAIKRCFGGLRASVWIAGFLLFHEIILSGSFLLSFIVIPLWFLGGISASAIRNEGKSVVWRRILLQALVACLVVGNTWFENKLAQSRAERIIQACNEYHQAKGHYPETLQALAPQYLPSVPHPKYAVMDIGFMYSHFRGKHSLNWIILPPFGWKYYVFEDARWGQLG